MRTGQPARRMDWTPARSMESVEYSNKAELKADEPFPVKLPSTEPSPPCEGCGGLYLFDTSIPSPLWNEVIRDHGLPEYLCLSCIVRAFAVAGRGFTAVLSGAGVEGLPIEIIVNSHRARDFSECEMVTIGLQADRAIKAEAEVAILTARLADCDAERSHLHAQADVKARSAGE